MAQFSELSIAIAEAEQLKRQRNQALLDLGRARMILATAKQLVREERLEINQLRRALEIHHRDNLKQAENLSAENELLRQQLCEVSAVRSRRLGLQPREQPTIPIMQDT